MASSGSMSCNFLSRCFLDTSSQVATPSMHAPQLSSSTPCNNQNSISTDGKEAFLCWAMLLPMRCVHALLTQQFLTSEGSSAASYVQTLRRRPNDAIAADAACHCRLSSAVGPIVNTVHMMKHCLLQGMQTQLQMTNLSPPGRIQALPLWEA